MPKKKKSGAAAVDDELILQCKFWKVAFTPPASKKEKPDESTARQNAIREALKKAEDAYNKTLREPEDAVKDWFFHRTEHAL